MSRRLRRTRTVTTLGPAADHNNNPEKVIAVDVNAVRVNFSHGSPRDHKLRMSRAREIAVRLGRHVAILGNLQGPKTRVPISKEGKVFLSVGDKFPLDTSLGKGEGDKEKVSIDYKGLPADVMPGDILLLDNGHVQFKMLEVQSMKVFTEVTVGGPLSSNKGINKLGGGLSAEALTEKDKADTITATQISVNYLAVSFPRCGEDLNYARRLMHDASCDVKTVVKIEHAEAVCDQNAIDGIILASDVVMVVRGDLGVEIGNPELVGIQKALICRACQLNRTATTATQMMKSMIINPMPARAEVMDVANAVLDGTDAAMLSAETAAGQYLAGTATAMARVCLGAERIPSINASKRRLDVQFDNTEETIAISAMRAASRLKGVTAIIIIMESDHTALATSHISSGLLIFAMSRHKHTLNLASLYRDAALVRSDSETDGVVAANEAMDLLHDKDYPISGDLVTVAQDDVMSTVGSTSTTHTLAIG